MATKTNGKAARNGSKPRIRAGVVALPEPPARRVPVENQLPFTIGLAGPFPGAAPESCSDTYYDWNAAIAHMGNEALQRGYALIVEGVSLEASAWVAAYVSQRIASEVRVRHVPEAKALLVWAIHPAHTSMDPLGALGDSDGPRECACCA